MNFTVTPQAKRKLYLMLITTLLLIDIAIIKLLHFNWRESALLLIATPTLLNLFLKFVMPLLQKKAGVIKKQVLKEFHSEDEEREYYIKLAKNEGKSRKKVGYGGKHYVYARNWTDAAKIYKEKIEPLTEKHPTKNFFFIHPNYNNL